MPDMFVQDILDPEEIEKRNAWNKRMNCPVVVNLDNYFHETQSIETLLSGEFISKIDPDNFRITDSVESLPSLPKITQDLRKLEHFSPVVSLLIDGTGYRNDAPDNVLPQAQFVVNRKKYTGTDKLFSDIKLLLDILFGYKGIGIKNKDQDFGFSKDNPFYIFVCGFNDNDLRQYMDEAVKITAEFDDNLVKIVGFLVPKVG